MAILIHTEFSVTREHSLDGAAVTVGRASHHTILTKDPKASRDQFRIDPGQGGFLVSDMGSRNGTRVNDRVLTRPELLASGDRITIGNAVFRFVVEGTGTAVDLPAVEATPQARRSAHELEEFLATNRHRIAGVGRLLAFIGILLAASIPALGVFLFLLGVALAILGACL